MAKLIGTNPDQVPTNADLGTMAYQDKDNVNVGSFTSNGIDDNATSTAMTLDSNGNLLVGTTSYDSNVEGVGIGADAFFYAARQRNTANTSQVAAFNRKGTDGNILRLDKDGTTVGSIGTNSGYPYIAGIAGADAGMIMGSGYIRPCDGNGTVKDDGVDLGNGAARFKDLYLSGGVYLGGTGAANKLDDYEEGTFTPTVFGATAAGTTVYGQQQGFYEKVGNVVNVMIGLSITSMSGTGSIKIGGLPFAAKNAAGYEANGSVMYTSLNIGSYTQLSPYIPYNTAVMDLFISTSNQSWTLVQAQGGWAMRITITYQV